MFIEDVLCARLPVLGSGNGIEKADERGFFPFGLRNKHGPETNDQVVCEIIAMCQAL